MKKLLVFAMKAEAQNYFTGEDVIFTGIGKVNATFVLTQKLMEMKASDGLPELVINFGSAGSSIFKTHELVEITSFVQRDMDVSPMGIPKYRTPYESAPWKIGNSRRFFPELAEGVAGTGDSFDISGHAPEWNLVEMEAYALAKVCWFFKLPFCSVKYITDGADHGAHNDFAANLPKAAAKFFELNEKL
ncbi:MAG: 5'-nucleosidase [Proteobacteria bacterium]|jgi:adenosylhomocysteine nucleosidase|nr:5'-nucleosidase [Pseudomonadota bacterium]